ncbi:MAG TPA: DUF1207 domain-containing protein [Ignavibacteriales bacterium]|nr:DUF1207 domain-containing protein [Ignavibacteriales bacterium]
MTEQSNKLIIKILALLLFSTSISFAQWQHELFPSDLNIQPFTANILEPKAGFVFAMDNNKLRLDISTSRDIVKWYDDDETISIGADLFTFTRLRSTDDFKFPVETIDYLFGLNAGYKKQLSDENELGLRFRLSHISAHLVDGQYDAENQEWRDGRDPFVFSKEFIELFPYYRVNTFRGYVGLTYIFHIIPEEIKQFNAQVGFDYFITQFGGETMTPFVAYDFKLAGNETYVGNNIFSVGVKFGNWKNKGLSLYYTYISGKSIHGEYYDVNENYSAVGFNFEL